MASPMPTPDDDDVPPPPPPPPLPSSSSSSSTLSPIEHRRRLQRRSVSANAVSDVFYRPGGYGYGYALADDGGGDDLLDQYYPGRGPPHMPTRPGHHPHHHQQQQQPQQQQAPPPPPLHFPLMSGPLTSRLTDTLGLIHPSAGSGAAAAGRGRRALNALRRPRHHHHHHHHRPRHPPIISPFRMMPTASNTALSRRIKNIFGLAVALVMCTVAPLELRSVWRERNNAAAAAAAAASAAVVLEGGGGGTGQRGGGGGMVKIRTEERADVVPPDQNGQVKHPSDQPTHHPPPRHHQRSSPLHPTPVLGPDPGPFATQAYANLHPPTRPDSIFGRISRRLLNLRLRISSRRNERLTYLEKSSLYNSNNNAAGLDNYDDDVLDGSGNSTILTKRERRRDRRQRRKERRQSIRSARQQVVTPYTILDSERLYQKMVELTEQYPELVRLENAQQRFGLPVAGGPEDCTYEPGELGEGCHNWYLVIEDGIYNNGGGRQGQEGQSRIVDEAAAEAAEGMPAGGGGGGGGDGGRDLDNNDDGPATATANADPYGSLPEVILSGALHGDERVGPTAVLETAAVLLESAWCESLPRMVLGDAGGKHTSNSKEDNVPSRRIRKRRRRKRRNVEKQQRRKYRVERSRRRAKRPSKEAEREYIAQKRQQRRQELLAQEEEQRPRSMAATYYPPEQLDEARICRSSLSSRGIPAAERRWLARLVSTRRIVILPTANALGYARNVRHEGDDESLDPNRDFPYDLTNPNMCMRTIAGRTVNELFRHHIFQMGMTFHGGMEAVAYEWGAPSYLLPQSPAGRSIPPSYAAPDSISQKQISQIYSSFGGKFVKNGGDLYPIGTMNELVYPVQGGMEDWSYAASWDTQHVVQCTPSTYGGYPAEKTTYNPANLRTFNALVETSNIKTPRDEDLGTDEDLLTPYGAGNGHISRNVRLSLALIDLAEPYVQILDAAGREIRDDVVPLSPRRFRSSMKTKVMAIPEGTGNVTVGWTVGGAISVDSTALMVGRWGDLDGTVFDGMSQPTKQQLDRYFASVSQGEDPIVWFSDAQGPGPARWNERLGYYDPSSFSATSTSSTASSAREDIPPEAVYRTEIDLSSFVEGDTVAVYAVARVDQSWAGQEGNVMGSLRPQTHVVNARTDPEWRQELVTDDSVSKIVQGRLDWFSVPLTIEVVTPRGPMLEKSVRSPDEEWTPEFETLSSHGLIKALISGAALAAVITACILVRESSDGTDCFSVWRQRRRIESEALPPEEYGITRGRRRRRRIGDGGSLYSYSEDDEDYAIS